MELFDLGPALSSKSVVLFESFHQLTVTTVPVSNLGTWHGWSLNHIGQTSTDHILKEVFCKARFPSIEQKEACFNISKKFKVLVRAEGGKGLHLGIGQVGFWVSAWFHLKLTRFHLGEVCSLLHLHSHSVVGRRCAKGDAWVQSTNLLNADYNPIMGLFPPGLANLLRW